MMPHRETSVQAYHETKALQASQTERVLNRLALLGMPQTRQQLAQDLGLDRGHACTRVKKLLDEGKIVECPGKSPCPVTGRTVTWVEIAPSVH